jgi:hypothetical protein
MPRIPVLNSRQTISTRVSQRQATNVPDSATGRALGQLTKTVENIGFDLAQKRQKQIDSTAELEFNVSVDKSYRTFMEDNQDRIDANGMIDGVEASVLAKEAAQETVRDVLEMNKNVSGNQAFKLNQMSQIKLDRIGAKALAQQNKIASKKTGQKFTEQGNTVINDAFSEDVLSTKTKLDALERAINDNPYIEDKNIINQVKEKAWSNKVEGAIQSENLRAAKDLVSRVPIGNNKKAKYLNRIESAQKAKDRSTMIEVRGDAQNLENAVKLGTASAEEISTGASRLRSKMATVSDPDLVKGMQDSIAMIEATADVSEILNDEPTNEWMGVIDNAVSGSKFGNTLEGRNTKKTLENNLKNIAAKRKELIDKDISSFLVSTDPTAKKLAAVATTNEGFRKWVNHVQAKAEQYGVGQDRIKVLPPTVKHMYSGLINSSDPRAIIDGLEKLEANVGSDYAFDKAVNEITNNPNIIAATSIADKNMAMKYLNAVNDKDFSKRYKDIIKSKGIPSEELNTSFSEVINDGDSGKFFDALSSMASVDGGRSFNAHLEAARKLYQVNIMENKSPSDAAKAIEEMFVGDNGKYEAVRTGTSRVLVPKNNTAGLSGNDVEIALEYAYDAPFEVVNLPQRYLELGGSEGSFKDQMHFKVAQDSSGIQLYANDGTKAFDSTGKPIILDWNEVKKVKDVALSKNRKSKTAKINLFGLSAGLSAVGK